MNRGYALFGLACLVGLLGYLVDHTFSGALNTGLNLLLGGAFCSGVGAYVLFKRKSLVEDYSTAFERSPGVRKLYTPWYRGLGFKKFQPYMMFTTVLVGSGFLMVGILVLGTLAYHLAEAFKRDTQLKYYGQSIDGALKSGYASASTFNERKEISAGLEYAATVILSTALQ